MLVGERAHGRPRQDQNANWNPFAQQRHAKGGTHVCELGSVRQRIFRIALRIGDVDDLAFEYHPPDRRSSTGLQGMTLKKLLLFRREAAAGDMVVGAIPREPDRYTVRFTKPSRQLDECIKHCLQIEGRAADDLEHVRGGGLLLQGLAQLVEQPSVLDGDDGLGGEVPNQLDLLFGEGAHLLSVDADGTDQLVFLEHGNAQECAGTPENDKRMLMVRLIGGNVGDMHDLFGVGHAVEAASGAWPNRRLAAAQVGIGCGHPVLGHDREHTIPI